MNNIWITTWYTVREALARKVFLFFIGLSALAIIITAIVVNVLSDAALQSSITAHNKDHVLGQIVTSIQLMITTPLVYLGVLLAIFSSASFIPHMLEKGNIDLLLSKPTPSLLIMPKNHSAATRPEVSTTFAPNFLLAIAPKIY